MDEAVATGVSSPFHQRAACIDSVAENSEFPCAENWIFSSPVMPSERKTKQQQHSHETL
jgi:hypothetical protein